MKIAVPKEIVEREKRVALAPESVKKLTKAGVEVVVESGAGERAYITDEEFREAGATVESDPGAVLSAGDFIFCVQPPSPHPDLGKHQVDCMREGAMLIGSLLPVRNTDAVRRLAERKITAFSTDAIPRTTKAQPMDTLSSMANIAGYKAVLIAADALPKYFPMFMTAAGTIFAAKVFVIGAGVAGLQAIATAKRLGATVTATDTRSVVKEQIESLGGRFVGVESDEDAQTEGGYAKELSKEFYAKQAELIKKACAQSDVVITTALIGGVKAPKLITEEMVKGMTPGSVIVDLASEAGGNCELTEPGQTIQKHGVTICGPLNLPSGMPLHASLLYSRNLTSFFTEFWDAEQKQFKLDLEDEILKGALITHEGRIVNEMARKAQEGGDGQ
ncbi:MAG: Re/Si-specific NAD(P)(+) transhydrogenase subunit alpha [Planctomycetota bacterium]|nr:MAG: Re/Si-specific NAD(P)(+) transhydrogenase subunit alpha [Planctomycetota bacterium]